MQTTPSNENEQAFTVALKGFIVSSRHSHVVPEKEEQDLHKQYWKERVPDAADRLIAAIGSVAGKRVLDIGSGSGWQAVSIGLKGADVFGVEPEARGVEASMLRARRYPHMRAEFKTGVAEHIPFPDVFFDVVVAFHAVEHVQDLARSLSEIRRVLKPCGFLYIETTNSMYPREEHYRIWWLPGMPKVLGAFYLRCLGKSPKMLYEEISYMFRGRLLRKVRDAGFSDARELYREYVQRKLSEPAAITNGLLRRMALEAKKLGILGLFARLLVGVGIYPSLWIVARKGAESGTPFDALRRV